jgi:carboxymethylenebutenolidase
MLPVNRVIGEGQLVDELSLSFTHTKPMPWFLPDLAPTLKKVVVDVVVVAQFVTASSLASASIGTTRTCCAK